MTAPSRNHVLYAAELVKGTPSGLDTKLGTWPWGGNEGTIGDHTATPANSSAGLLVQLGSDAGTPRRWLHLLGELEANPSTTRYAVSPATVITSVGRTSPSTANRSATMAGVRSTGASQNVSSPPRAERSPDADCCSDVAARRRTRPTAPRISLRFLPRRGVEGSIGDDVMGDNVTSSSRGTSPASKSEAKDGMAPPGRNRQVSRALRWSAAKFRILSHTWCLQP